MQELKPQPDPRRTLFRAIGVLIMFVIAVTGLLYSAYVIWTGK